MGFSPPWGLPKLGNFRFSPPWGLSKRRNFHFSPVKLPKLRIFTFPPVGLPKLGNFISPPVGASQAREFSLFPAVTASQAMEFSLFPPLEALQAAEFQIARQRRLDSPPNPVFFECVSMFLQWFPSKHGTLHFCRHKTGKTSCSTMLPIPLSPQPLKIPLFTVFSSFFPCSNAGSQLQHIYIYIYIRNPSKTLFFDSVFPMFPVKQTVIYTFFAIKAVNPSKTLLLTVFCNVSSQAYGNLRVLL